MCTSIYQKIDSLIESNPDVWRRMQVQYSTVQYSTVQYSTVQYSTVQYSTVQYSTVQDILNQSNSPATYVDCFPTPGHSNFSWCHLIIKIFDC